MDAHAAEGSSPASIAVWTVPKEVSAGKDFRAIGPASFELGTITPPEAPAPSSPPALPFSYVNAFHLVALRSCTCELGVQLTSSSEPMSVKQHIEVAP